MLLMNTDKIEETVLLQPIQRFCPFINIKDEQNNKFFNQIWRFRIYTVCKKKRKIQKGEIYRKLTQSLMHKSCYMHWCDWCLSIPFPLSYVIDALWVHFKYLLSVFKDNILFCYLTCLIFFITRMSVYFGGVHFPVKGTENSHLNGRWCRLQHALQINLILKKKSKL